MPLDIEYNDAPSLTIYAILFDSVDKEQAFNPSTNKFEDYTLVSQSDFAITLDEDLERVGFYSFTISDVSGIPPTVDDDWYLIEIYSMTGSSFDRESDTLSGTTVFYWDGEKEVALCSPCDEECPTIEIPEGLTAKEVWEFETRTLTEAFPEIPPCPEIPECPDNSEELEELKKQLEEHQEAVSKKLEEIEKLIEETCGTDDRDLPPTPPPTITPGGDNNPDIRFT